MITAVILYPKYEHMHIHSHNAAYSQLQNINDNASVNPCYLRMFINKKFVYLRSIIQCYCIWCVWRLPRVFIRWRSIVAYKRYKAVIIAIVVYNRLL